MNKPREKITKYFLEDIEVLIDCIIESYDIYYEELISRNKEITIVFPTATLNLANNDIIFDIANTPSYLMGSFSEYLRRKKRS